MNQTPIGDIGGLDKRAYFARAIAGFVAFSSALTAICVLLLAQGQMASDAFYLEDLHLIDYLVMVQALALLVSFVVVSLWIHRAHKNLHDAEFPALEYTPGWAIAWYAIPIANLFKPFQAMRELWHASHGSFGDYEKEVPGLLWLWWLSWIFSSISSFGNELGWRDAIGLSLTCVSAIALIVIITKITAAQPTMSISSAFD